MKHISTKFIALLIALFLSIGSSYASKIVFDQKYVSVGVFTNSGLPQFTKNANMRLYGGADFYSAISGDKSARNDLLKELFSCRNTGKPNIEPLYRQALAETTQEEVEIAVKDVSAEPEAVLKNDIVRQLLKNNYIVNVERVPNHDKHGNVKQNKDGKSKGYHVEWTVYHIDIDDEIINQAFYNWDNQSAFGQIDVPVSFVAKGCIKEKQLDRIIVEIAKKVPAFAIRGPITNNHPSLASTTSLQGIQTGDRFRVYRMYEDNAGRKYSKKVSEARVLTADTMQTKLKIIAGRYPNYKNGEVAALYGWTKQSITFQGQYSFGGDDPRIGGRITYEWMPKYTSSGIAHYIYAALEYQQFKSDPDGVWFKSIDFNSDCLNPQLKSFGVYVGYGLGISFLTKMEITPYVLGGMNLFTFTGMKDGAYIWNADQQMFNGIGMGPNGPTTSIGFTVYGGVRLAYNICYPVQLVLGAEYGATVVPDEKFHPISNRHELCRLNVFGGLRFNF